MLPATPLPRPTSTATVHAAVRAAGPADTTVGPARTGDAPEPRESATAGGAVRLLTAAAAGDERARAELVTRHQPMLAAIARRQGMSADDAADVAQETWLRFFTQLPAIRDGDRVPGWLATTVRRECIARRRRVWRESPTGDGTQADGPVDGADPLDRIEAEQRDARLHDAVRGLPDRERALVEVLLEPDPLTYAEISRRLGMPIGSIGPVRARALRRLRLALSGERDDDRPAA